MNFPYYIPRLLSHLKACGERYPRAWRNIDKARNDRAQLGDWPSWCFCPLAASYAIVCDQHEVDDLSRYSNVSAYSSDERKNAKLPILDIGRIGALAAWRVSQGIHWIDDAVRLAVMDTPLSGEIPVDILLALPEWCIYVPTPGHVIDGGEVSGFFAHLERDANRLEIELRLLVDFTVGPPMDALMPEIVHLHPGLTFAESYERMLVEMAKQAALHGADQASYETAAKVMRETARERVTPLLNLLLYLCSSTAEYHDAGRPGSVKPTHPSPKRTKDGWRLFPPDRPQIWTVGDRLGKAIREATEQAKRDDVHRAGPRPHVRRAHWHSFWRGSKSEPSLRKIVLKWLPPMAVAMVDEEDRNGRE